jgi:PAS domain S-box-containing protein
MVELLFAKFLVFSLLPGNPSLLFFGFLGAAISFIVDGIRRQNRALTSTKELLEASNTKLAQRSTDLIQSNEKLTQLAHAGLDLAAIVEGSEDAIISKDLHSVVLTWNAGAERIYGYSAAEAKGRPMSFLLPVDRSHEEDEILDNIKQGVRVEHFETVRVRKNGRQIYVSLTISPIRDGDAIIGASHIARDIGAQKKSASLLRDSEAKLRAFLETASQGIVIVGAKGAIQLVNARAEEMFGYGRLELIGAELGMLIPEAYRAKHVDRCGSFFASPRTRPMGDGLDIFGRHKDGTEFPAEIALSFISSDEGPIAMAFVNDIGERKRSEVHFRETQKLESIGVLAGGVAHDFNNLLTGILGNTSLALEILPAHHSARELLINAMTASERAADLTRQLLAYAGKGRFIIEPIDLSVLIQGIAPLLTGSIPKTVQLRLDLADNLPYVDADSSQIQQIVMNLVINGAEAIGENRTGTVLVTTRLQDVGDAYTASMIGRDKELPPGPYVTMEIQDNGCGMDNATLSRIFDPFFTTKFTGRGLGLAAVQGIVRGHKAALTVSSVQGQSSAFKLFFPVTRKRPVIDVPGAAAAVGEALTGHTTILFIDDEQTVLNVGKRTLEKYGYTVVVAENGQNGVDLFRANADKISLIILDMTMPVMSGQETFRNLKLIAPAAKVLLSSGYDQSEAVRRFAGKGLIGFLQKPYSSIVLAQSVKAALDSM